MRSGSLMGSLGFCAVLNVGSRGFLIGLIVSYGCACTRGEGGRDLEGLENCIARKMDLRWI